MKKVAALSWLTLFAFGAGSLPAADPAKKAKKKGPDLEAVFKKLDTNNDNKLSKDEFAKYAGEVKGKKAAQNVNAVAADADKKKAKAATKAKQLAEGLFIKLDTNKDNFLSLDEFKRLTELLAEQKKQKKANKTD